MSLQPKVIGLIFVVFLIYGVLNYTAQFWLILPSFAALEREQAAKNMDRVVQVIERETRHLAIVAADWAMRDDTYQFVQDRYETYVKKELDDVAIQNLKVNLMCFFDRARNKVWEITFDLGEKAAIPIEVFPATLPEGHPLAALSKPDSEVTGILITEQGPALVAAKPVVTSKNQGPVRGTLVMGRFLDTAAIATQAQAPLTVSWVQDAGLSSELSAAIAELGGSSRSLIHEGADQNRVYRVLPDILGRPALLLQINVPKTIFARGQAAVDFALLVSFMD